MSRFIFRGMLSCAALFTLLFSMGCGEDDTAPSTVPELTTLAVTSITPSTAESGGTIISDGGEEITLYGVCWSTSPDPTIDNEKTTLVSGTDEFTSSLTNLNSNTTYFVRAYASNKIGTGYGSSVSFTTGEITLATVTTILPNESIFSAESGGIITSNGDGTITARGICWSTHENPTVADSKTMDGAGDGTFTSQLTGLASRTTYYVRAYATNEAGTAYGNLIEFMTHDEFSGIYEVLSGTAYWTNPDGSMNPDLSGDYTIGHTIQMENILFGRDTIRFFPEHVSGQTPGLDPTIVIVDRTITFPDGSHPVKIMSLANVTLQNIPGTESRFYPGEPGIPGAPDKQGFLLNFEWKVGGFIYRSVTNYEVRFKSEFNAD